MDCLSHVRMTLSMEHSASFYGFHFAEQSLTLPRSVLTDPNLKYLHDLMAPILICLN